MGRGGQAAQVSCDSLAPGQESDLREGLQMNLRNAPKLLIAFVLAVTALAAGYETGKPIKIKGYVLDSACAFTKGLKKPKQGLRHLLCEGGFSLGDPDRRRNNLLAHRRHHPGKRTKRKTTAVRRTEGHRHRKSLSKGRLERVSHREGRTPIRSEVDPLLAQPSCFVVCPFGDALNHGAPPGM